MARDLTDRKILLALDRNSRASFSEIAREFRLSHDTVRYRIERLLAEGVVVKLHTAVDMAKLGFSMYGVRLKLHRADERETNAIIAYLVEQPCVTWVVRFDGLFDIGIALRVRSIVELDQFVETLLHKHAQYIRQHTFQVITLCEYLSRDYLVEKTRAKGGTLHHVASAEKSLALDRVNRSILTQMSTSSRVSAADIARALERESILLSPEAVTQRIRRLEEDKIITGYKIALNNSSLDQLFYKVMINSTYVGPAAWSEFVRYCRTISRIVYLTKSLGEWDFEIDLEVETVARYREIMGDLTAKFPQVIRDFNALLVVDIHKYHTGSALKLLAHF